MRILAVLHHTILAGAVAIAALLWAAPGASAADGPVLLTVDLGTEIVTFDRSGLMNLPQHTIRTSTIWTDGVQEFTGVRLADLIGALRLEGEVLRATAINDYAVMIPLEDAVTEDALVAYERNGEPMSVRDKGPLWVVYPFDDNPDYQSEVYYSRSIWQLDRLQIQR